MLKKHSRQDPLQPTFSDFGCLARNWTFSTDTTDSVNHLYVILLSEVSRTDIADAMKKLQQSEKALELAIVHIGHELGHVARKARNGFPLVSLQWLCGIKYAQLCVQMSNPYSGGGRHDRPIDSPS